MIIKVWVIVENNDISDLFKILKCCLVKDILRGWKIVSYYREIIFENNVFW